MDEPVIQLFINHCHVNVVIQCQEWFLVSILLPHPADRDSKNRLEEKKQENFSFSQTVSQTCDDGGMKGGWPHLHSHSVSAAFHVFPYWVLCRNLCESRIRLNVLDAGETDALQNGRRLNMAVSQTSKAGINCLHHHSSELIYTADKYRKYCAFVLPHTTKMRNPQPC